MIIGFDASRAARGQRTGTERYSLEILRSLLRLPAAKEHEWRLYLEGATPDDAFAAVAATAAPTGAPTVSAHALDPDVTVEIRSLPRRRAWTHRSLAAEIRRHPPHVLFVPAHVIPLRLGRTPLPPSVVTVHDLGYHRWPATHTRSQRVYLNLSTRLSVAAARQVICVSQATADDLHAIYGTDRRKLHVIHEGITQLAPPGSAAACRQRYGLSRPYALYVGTIQPRKNLARLLRAYAALAANDDLSWDLVLAGKPGWHSDAIFDLLRDLKLDHRVHYLGYVPEADLSTLLAAAHFFTFPSLHEGFGLPVLEAQSLGVPVMTADNSSLPEIAGDAALLVDATDVDAIAQAMLQLSQDEALRQRLIAAGYENVKRFSWEKAAAETLAVLEQAAREPAHD